MNLVSIKQAAVKKGVSTSAIYRALARERIYLHDDEEHIDLEDPRNLGYFATAKKTHLTNNKHADANKQSMSKNLSFDAYLDYCEECQDEDVKPEDYEVWKHSKKIEARVLRETTSDSIDDIGLLAIQKIKIDIASKSSAKLKNDIANAEKLGAIVDLNTIQKKFGAFYDVFINEIAPMPRAIADILWQKAKDAENPELVIIEELEDKLKSIIERAKAAAKEIRTDDRAIEYILTTDKE